MNAWLACRWRGNGGKGEKLRFRMKTLRLPVALKVVAMDEDVDNDDHIGTGVLTLPPEMLDDFQSSNTWMHDSWIPLTSLSGKATGRIRTKVSWSPKIYTAKELAEKHKAEENQKLLTMWGMVRM